MAQPAQIFLRHTPTTTPASQSLLIFFITGNPGTIGYYRATLEQISTSLAESSLGQNSNIHVFGSSLVGFDEHEGVPPPISAHASSGPLSLRAQILYVKHTLLTATRQITAEDHGRAPLVILVGHSIGAYILLEIISDLQPPRGQISLEDIDLKIASGICLFPTVVDIAKSSTGRTMALITGMEPASAKTTAQFLHSPNGVHQALFLAADEMRSVTSDRWNDGLWGLDADEATSAKLPELATAAQTRTKLFFYWGENDHWVADSTRDTLIMQRGRNVESAQKEDRKPVMEIDQHGVPHAFPVKQAHGRIVANKVVEWTLQITKQHPPKQAS
ncbi:hypothetical protein LTR62_001576 [Meristemomyces frigidus]|uniref:Uncharacterized protein n=1 Tax=Meristemomyces frigidus TaxID=1508187 RepID=A0AAN7YL09_9PEZI|nr:hypothetical protein LTR62_001576 [Meristemomyces frigidus]